MGKRFISILFLIVCTSIFIGCTASNQGSSDQKQWKHFRMDITVEDSKEVTILQDSLEITPHLSSVILCVNITNAEMSTLTIGDEKDPNATGYSWEQIPKSVREYLLNYTGPKKIKL